MRAWVRLARLLLRWQHLLFGASLLGMLALHGLRAALPPPPRFLWLYDRAFITFAFAHFAAAFAFLQGLQWVSGMEEAAQAQAAGHQSKAKAQ